MQKEEIRAIIQDLIKAVLEETDSNLKILDETVINTPLMTNMNEFNKAESLSSLQIVTLIVSIENKFQIEISDEAMISFKTINDLVEIVDSNINASLV